MTQTTTRISTGDVAPGAAPEGFRRSEEAFRLLVESVRDYAIFMLDPRGVIATWNRGAERLKGYAAGEIIGKHFSVFYPAEDKAARKPERELEIAIAEGRVEDEGWRVRKDGTLFWANVVITAVHDATGELRGFAKVTRDLSERRRHEEERVALARANEAIRLRDEFLSIAAHELRTPVNAIVLQLAALRLASKKRLLEPAALDVQVERADRQVRRLNDLIEGLLDVSRLVTGRLTLNRAPMALVAVSRGIIFELEHAASTAGCVCTVTAPDLDITGTWDALRVGQVLTNLLTNAFRYGAGKPVDVVIGTDGTAARVSVTDRGIGILPADQAKIFERFERGTASRDRAGLGIGLYVARSIVEAHGGTICVDSEPGLRSTFTFTLPLAAESR